MECQNAWWDENMSDYRNPLPFTQVSSNSSSTEVTTYLKLHSGYAMQSAVRDKCVEQKTI